MTLGTRKIIILSLLGFVFLVSNILIVADWLSEKGVIDWAVNFRAEYLTGTAITIIVVLLILIVGSRTTGPRLAGRCPVCDHVLIDRKNYCSECGSRIV